tara:strand:+ start:547 stop:891 length:345 start_codon:yes stop_codon:yes gene_type:complete
MNKTVTKPWGFYVQLAVGDGWLTKMLEINPHQRLSLQRHRYRDEHWVIASGIAIVQVGDKTVRMTEGQHIQINAHDWHRVTGGNDGCTIIETWIGGCNEQDIERKEDDYGRVTT